MKNKLILFSLISLSLAGCAKTDLLYKENAYNSPVFDENYYLERADIDSLKIHQEYQPPINDLQSNSGLNGIREEDRGGYKWNDFENNNMWGYHNNLDNIEEKFNYGILSKLYDGRVRCDGLYQKSRVQLNKTGYATYFPKTLSNSKFIAFSCRGGTNLEQSIKQELLMNFKISFYIHLTNSNEYDKLTFNLKNLKIKTDYGESDPGNMTSLVSFYLPDLTCLSGAVAMSFEWSCEDPLLDSYNLTDDYSNKEKPHLALMLYEVFIPQSTWF